jgi:hypothetical protein
MATIKSTDLITSASILAQQFSKRPVAWAADTQRSSSVSVDPAAAQQNKPDPQSALTAYLKKWADAKQAIEKLNQIPQDIKQSRKAAAVEMIQRIKEQIRILMMLGAGNPKATAQQVALLARQLAAATREYAAASGGDTQANAASSANNLSAQNDAAASSSGEQSTAASAAPATTDAVASTTPDASAASAAVAASSITAASPAEAQSPSQHVGEQIRSKVAEYAQNASESNSDQEFIKEVKKLVAQLKALAKQNQVHSPKHPEKSTDREMESINEALKEVERSLASIDSANSTVTVSIDVVAK